MAELALWPPGFQEGRELGLEPGRRRSRWKAVRRRFELGLLEANQDGPTIETERTFATEVSTSRSAASLAAIQGWLLGGYRTVFRCPGVAIRP